MNVRVLTTRSVSSNAAHWHARCVCAVPLLLLPSLGDLLESLGGWATLLPLLFFAVNLLRAGMLWLEPVLLHWLPLAAHPGFWIFWTNLVWTVDYITTSFPRQQKVTQQLHAWEREREGLPPMKWVQVQSVSGNGTKEVEK